MEKRNKRIIIAASASRELSSMSQPSRLSLQAALSAHYSDVSIALINNLQDLAALAALRPDVVFLGVKFIVNDDSGGHGPAGKIWVNEYLEAQGIVCVGSGYQAHQLESDKQLAKRRVQIAGLPTAKFYVAANGVYTAPEEQGMAYPVFIKPTNRGGGTGIDSLSLAHTAGQVHAKVQALADGLRADALVEEYLPGREFSVGILKDLRTGSYAALPLELIAPPNADGSRFLSADVKSADTERAIAVPDSPLRAKLNALALNVFSALGARDYGRIDIRLDAAGRPHFLEANLLPSLLDGYGNFPKTCLLNLGLGYEPMVLQLVQLALQRAAEFAEPSYELNYSHSPALLASLRSSLNPA